MALVCRLKGFPRSDVTTVTPAWRDLLVHNQTRNQVRGAETGNRMYYACAVTGVNGSSDPLMYLQTQHIGDSVWALWGEPPGDSAWLIRIRREGFCLSVS
jgi:hypothetical protein